jgi:hypothetical protein
MELLRGATRRGECSWYAFSINHGRLVALSFMLLAS